MGQYLVCKYDDINGCIHEILRTESIHEAKRCQAELNNINDGGYVFIAYIEDTSLYGRSVLLASPATKHLKYEEDGE